jgi:hypothetical protein
VLEELKGSSRDTAIMINRQRHNISGFEGNGTECREWSDLPVNVLDVIAARLDALDQIYFRAVCKNWGQTRRFPVNKTLPWLLEHGWGFDENVYSVCSFHRPSANPSHVPYSKIEREEFKVLHGAAICASKFGWLLLQKSSLSFFYNPYTKSIIKLPDLNLSFNRTTFSSVPTSPDCFCFAIQSSKNDHRIYLSICHPGDREWSTLILDGFRRAVEDVVYSNGTFYCVFTRGALGAFRVADQHWSLLTNRKQIDRALFQSRAHMVASNGELWLVCPSKGFEVFRFDWSVMTWVQANTLGSQALFLGCTSLSVSAEGETSGFAERIYYRYGIYSYCYSMETKQRCRCTLYPRDANGGTERVWIQPPEI